MAMNVCERCAAVCDASCRTAAVREQALLQVLRVVGRV
jgi:hypothetical protein